MRNSVNVIELRTFIIFIGLKIMSVGLLHLIPLPTADLTLFNCMSVANFGYFCIEMCSRPSALHDDCALYSYFFVNFNFRGSRFIYPQNLMRFVELLLNHY